MVIIEEKYVFPIKTKQSWLDNRFFLWHLSINNFEIMLQLQKKVFWMVCLYNNHSCVFLFCFCEKFKKKKRIPIFFKRGCKTLTLCSCLVSFSFGDFTLSIYIKKSTVRKRFSSLCRQIPKCEHVYISWTETEVQQSTIKNKTNLNSQLST